MFIPVISGNKMLTQILAMWRDWNKLWSFFNMIILTCSHVLFCQYDFLLTIILTCCQFNFWYCFNEISLSCLPRFFTIEIGCRPYFDVVNSSCPSSTWSIWAVGPTLTRANKIWLLLRQDHFRLCFYINKLGSCFGKINLCCVQCFHRINLSRVSTR